MTESRSEDNMEDLWDDMENDDFEEIIDVILGIREDVKMGRQKQHHTIP